MALIKCKECAGEVSTKAKNCPKCNAPVEQQLPMWIQAISTFLAIGLMFWLVAPWDHTEKKTPSAASTESTTTSNPQVSATQPQKSNKQAETISLYGQKTTINDVFACYEKDDYIKVVFMAHDNDKEAIALMVLEQRCYLLNEDSKVSVEDTSISQGLIKIREKGSTLSAWTSIEAIRSQDKKQ